MKGLIDNIGRVLFSAPFIVFGIFHFMNLEGMSAMVPSFLSWGASFFVVFTGIALILAGISFLVNKFVKWSGLLLAAQMLIFAITVHLLAVLGGDEMAMGQLLKDLALAGGALILASTEW